MVIEEFSKQVLPAKAHSIAPTEDRLLAVIFDLVLFSPFVSLMLAQIFKQMELVQTVSPQSSEYTVLVIVMILFAFILTLLLNTLCLYILGATPGKYFFKIRVVPYEPTSGQTRLTFNQAFLRSLLWCMEVCLIALPWLEVFSDPKRRILHDRASNTIVITKKNIIERGPHILEAQLVRQFLLFTAFFVCAFSIYIGGRYYRMAARGEFRRAELEATDFFCPEVTASLDSKDVRIDKALALFLAGEIADDCLNSETEFAIWWPSQGDKSWAYLAKAILKKSDVEKSEEYLQKACDENEEGPACELAQFQANPRGKKVPGNSETSQILAVIQQFEQGNYKTAEEDFTKLGKARGYETFAGQGLVKAFWAQNKIEKSQGAFAGVVNQMSENAKAELSAWICHEELDQNCSSDLVEACEVLKEDKRPPQDSFVALALIREKECRHSSQIDYLQFHDLFEERADVLQFVKAIAQESQWSHQQRMSALQDLSFRKESVRPSFLRLMAIQEWVGQSTASSDFHFVTAFLKEKKVRDLSWVKIYKKTMDALVKNKDSKALKEIAALPSADMIASYKLNKLQGLAKEVIASTKQTNENRLPASKGDQ